jgi:hypothetical protein
MMRDPLKRIFGTREVLGHRIVASLKICKAAKVTYVHQFMAYKVILGVGRRR